MKIYTKLLWLAAMAALPFLALAQPAATDWYEITTVNKPFVRWWWHGSAVDSVGLTYNLEEFARQGLGGVEITPIYGVQGNEANDIPYLSEKWMDMLGHVTAEGRRLGMQTEMNNGTGWPFGGPEVTEHESAQKLIIRSWDVANGAKLAGRVEPEDERQRPVATVEAIMAVDGDTRLDITNRLANDGTLNWTAPSKGSWRVYALFAGRTFQKVKRAAPGGEGYVVNHYDSTAVKKYLDRFDRAFAGREDIFPKVLFNDSYEVYGSDWTAGLLSEFAKEHGYRLEHYIPELADAGNHSELRDRLVRDYRHTLARVLRENFTDVWTRWAHSHGAQIRNQSHGSPANILDLYAIVDIPECESFGRSDFDIPGLHPTGPMKKSDADPAVLKFASSAAHLAGKPLISAETLTWLTQHFHTSLSVAKPEIDQMLAAGVNHVFFHGATYSPKGVDFPGWLFYASVNMSPTNTIWKDADALFSYIARCQAFLTAGSPDSDVLLYFPIDDIWSRQGGLYMMFAIHDMDKTMPDVKAMVRELVDAGLDPDYLSDALAAQLSVTPSGTIAAAGSEYKAIIVPPIKYMPAETLSTLKRLESEGAKVIWVEQLPLDVPGLANLDARRAQFEALKSDMAAPAMDMQEAIKMCGAKPEPLRGNGISLLRRTNEVGGHNYFMALLGDTCLDGWHTLATPSEAVMIFDPLTGKKGKARSRRSAEGLTEVYLQAEPGQSLLLKTFPTDVAAPDWAYLEKQSYPITLSKGWSIEFLESQPQIEGVFHTDTLTAWTNLPLEEAKTNTATARYSVEFTLPADAGADEWLLDLGDLRESAEVWVNGTNAGKVWSVPFTIEVGRWLKPGKNVLEIDVTNLPANRIADYDRKGKKWRIFKDANIANVDGSRLNDYSAWPLVPAGLNSEVTLTPLRRKYPNP